VVVVYTSQKMEIDIHQSRVVSKDITLLT